MSTGAGRAEREGQYSGNREWSFVCDGVYAASTGIPSVWLIRGELAGLRVALENNIGNDLPGFRNALEVAYRAALNERYF